MDDLALPAWMVLPWWGVIGGTVGSFMNVVVYRLPLGLSLNHPGSHCPHCQHPIRWRDNLPVLGWLLLRGRCRDCRAPISARYPLVEAGVAALFVLLAWVEVYPESTFFARGLTSSLTDSQRWLTCAYHLLLLCPLVCAALMEYDGRAVPLRLSLFAATIGIAAPLAFPYLHLAPLGFPLPGFFPATPSSVDVLKSLAGAAAGAGWGAFLALRGAAPRWKNDLATRGFLLAALGIFLGWQAVCVSGLAAAIFYLLANFALLRPTHSRMVGWSACLTLATLLLLLVWSVQPQFHPAWYRPLGGSELSLFTILSAMVWILLRLTRRSMRAADPTTSKEPPA